MRKPKKSQEIAKKLIERIKSGEFPPGTRLPSETDLAVMFGVSRATIREALSMLNAMGILSSQQGGGNYVEDLDPSALMAPLKVDKADVQTMKHLFEIRTILETEAAYLAAIRRTPKDLKRMFQALQNLQSDFATENSTGLEADFAFHREMIRATHNPILIATMDSLSHYYQQVLSVTLQQNIGLKRKRQQVFKENEAIYLAIEAGQPELAKVQCAIHLQNVAKKLRLVME